MVEVPTTDRQDERGSTPRPDVRPSATVRLRIAGVLDAPASASLVTAIEDRMRGPVSRILIDADDLEFADDAARAEMARLHRDVAQSATGCVIIWSRGAVGSAGRQAEPAVHRRPHRHRPGWRHRPREPRERRAS